MIEHDCPRCGFDSDEAWQYCDVCPYCQAELDAAREAEDAERGLNDEPRLTAD